MPVNFHTYCIMPRGWTSLLQVKTCTVNASAGVTLSRFDGDSGEAVVGLCEGGASLAVFGPSFETASVGVLPLPAGLLGVTRMMPSALVDLAGSFGRVLQLRDASSGASVAIALSSGSDGGKGGACVRMLIFLNEMRSSRRISGGGYEMGVKMMGAVDVSLLFS